MSIFLFVLYFHISSIYIQLLLCYLMNIEKETSSLLASSLYLCIHQVSDFALLSFVYLPDS